jgi:hypothetical protein
MGMRRSAEGKGGRKGGREGGLTNECVWRGRIESHVYEDPIGQVELEAGIEALSG